MAVLGSLCAIFIPVLGGYAIIDTIENGNNANTTGILITLPILAIMRGVLHYAEQNRNHYLAFKLLALVRDKVFASLRRLAPAKLEGRDKGDLIAILTADIELLEVFYAHTISPICIATIVSVFMVCMIGKYHWILGVITGISYGIIGILVPMIAAKRSRKYGEDFRKEFGELDAFVLESLRGVKESIQYQTEKKRLQEIYSHTDTLANLGVGLQNTFAAGNRVIDILDEVPVIEEISNGKNIIFDDVICNGVSFSYDQEEILHDFSFELKKNEILGIEGKSGCGKSTLLKLLMRFWDVEQGSITFAKENISEINTKCLRDTESFVTQETQLFHDSIKRNLLIAKTDATQEEMVAACKKASIHEFIMSLPEQYETKIGELGETISGGERQRIGLARAFLHNAPFILLDEPTSNLDSLNEAVILKSLQDSAKDKTVILVSHRKSTMCVADRVISIENGRLS